VVNVPLATSTSSTWTFTTIIVVNVPLESPSAMRGMLTTQIGRRTHRGPRILGRRGRPLAQRVTKQPRARRQAAASSTS
jgi:hypothetical protein